MEPSPAWTRAGMLKDLASVASVAMTTSRATNRTFQLLLSAYECVAGDARRVGVQQNSTSVTAGAV